MHRAIPVIATTLLSSLFVLSVPLVGPCIHLLMQTSDNAIIVTVPIEVPAVMATSAVPDSIADGLLTMCKLSPVALVVAVELNFSSGK